MNNEPKKMDFERVPKHSRLDMFEESVTRAESWFDWLLGTPIAVSACVLIAYVAILATIIGYLS